MEFSTPSKQFRTWIEIDRRSLFFNLRQFERLARGAALMAVVKSNAYGHGLTLIAKLLARRSPARPAGGLGKGGWFGVDSVVEALRLRREGVKNQILVLGYTLPQRYADAARRNVTLTISHFDGLRALARARRRPAFHLKLDTGMHRQGFQEHELAKLIIALKRFHLDPAGIYSHFAAEDNKKFSHQQIALFERLIAAFRAGGVNAGIRHLSRTGGVVNYPEANYDLVRIGLGLYGYLPRLWNSRRRRVPLRPVLTWKTIVGEVKRIKSGERIGYGLTERFRRDSTIAILPIGYWHGYDRGLSSIGEVLIRGKRAKVLGRVSMDMTAVDVTDIRGVRIGDEVVLIGRQVPRPRGPGSRPARRAGLGSREFISADEVADKLKTISYEVLTRINPLIERILK